MSFSTNCNCWWIFRVFKIKIHIFFSSKNCYKVLYSRGESDQLNVQCKKNWISNNNRTHATERFFCCLFDFFLGSNLTSVMYFRYDYDTTYKCSQRRRKKTQATTHRDRCLKHLVKMTKIFSCIDINRIYGLLLIFMDRSVGILCRVRSFSYSLCVFI